MINFTIGFHDYQGNLHHGNGILAGSVSEALESFWNWMEENRPDARECEVAFVKDASGKTLYPSAPINKN